MNHDPITHPDPAILTELREKINQKTKPLGALGQLEDLALKIDHILQSSEPQLAHPHIIVFAGSHGIAAEGVSAYPSEVTYQMVLNFLGGGAAINVFTRQHHIELLLVDAGVDHEFEKKEGLIHAKINYGTKSFLKGHAMTAEECHLSMEKGTELVCDVRKKGCNVIGFGEMGIGNTSAAALIMHKLLELPLEECTGRGTGLDETQYQNKLSILQQASDFHNGTLSGNDPLAVLRTFGGYEMSMMCGAMLQAAREGMIILVDGFISGAAFLCAYKLSPAVKSYSVFSHLSDENGHAFLMEQLEVKPLLKLNMRLGEGSGCALAYPLLQSAVAFMNEMASFESAGVSNKEM